MIRNNKKFRYAAGILSICILMAAAAFAQTTTSTLVGRVSDNNDAAVAGAEVLVTQVGTNFSRTTTTNENGEYTVAQIPPSIYMITVKMAGFKTGASEEVTLLTDTTTRINVVLEAGDISETVTVNSDPPVINSETPEKGEVITERQVTEMQLNGRDFTDLALIVPGIYRRPSDGDHGQGVGAAGTRTDSTNFTLDGVSNRDDRNGGIGVNTSIDSIQEFKVSTSSYSAESGRVGGGQISVVSKSGTNRFSGSLFHFLRNDALDANDYFAGGEADKKLRRNQFGGSIGGPMPFFNFGEGGPSFNSGRDQTFFFATFEQLREIRSVSSLTVAPNAEWKVGDFRNMRGAGPDGIWGNADDTNRVMCLRVSSNPLRPTKVECPTPNVIPLSAVPGDPTLIPASPISLAMMDYLPTANEGIDGYRFSVPITRLPNNLFSLKFDHKLNGKNNMYFRYAYDGRDQRTAGAPGRVAYPGFGRDVVNRKDSYAFGDTHTFSPTLINEFRFGFLDQDMKTVNQNNDVDYIGLFGIPGLATGQIEEWQGFPAIRIDGFPDTGDSANTPFNYVYRNLSLYDSVTWIKGNHNFKFGVEAVRPNYIETDIRNVRGDFRFRGRFTNSVNSTANGFRSFADFVYGIPDSTQRQIGAQAADLRGWQTAFYIQDNWRVNNWLTLNLGLRYDYTPFLHEKDNRLSNFVPELGISVCGDGQQTLPTGEIVCLDARELGMPRSLVDTDTNNLAPRVGFALKPFGDDKTVIRGGAGIFFSSETINPARQQLANNYPYLVRQQFGRASTADILQLTLDNPFPDNRASLQGVATPQGIPQDSQTPEVYHFNLTFERELAADLGLELGYVGSQGRRLGMRYNLNYPYPTGELNQTTGVPITARPYPALSDIQYQIQGVNSNYNAFQAALRRRSKNGLTMLMSYTFSKAMDQNSNTNNSTTGAQRNPQDVRDFRRDWALADFHRTHQFSASFNYLLPFGRRGQFFSSARGLTDALIGGWQINGIVTLLSGRPFTPVFSTLDTAGGRPDLIGDPMANVPPGLYFNPAAFGRPVASAGDPTVFGNAGRNLVIGPNYQSVDLSLFKNFRVGERSKLQFRWELFNALNHPNFQIPQHLLETSNTGEFFQTTTAMREMQFAVRFTF